MKIVIINASARKNGATSKILNEFSQNLSAKNDVDVQSINLSDLKLNFCLGCCQCYKNGVCHIDDDAEMLSELIDNSDGIIIGTPTYSSSISGQLKTFIDRGHFVIEQLLKGKYTIGVVTYENADGNAAYKALKKLFVYSGAKTADKFLLKLPFNSNPLDNTKIKAEINNQCNKLHKSIANKRKANLKNKITHFFVFNFGIKPFVYKKGASYNGVLKLWQKRNVKLHNVSQ